MSETKEFIQKIINSFTPNTPLIVKEFISTDDHYLVFVTLYYGHKVPTYISTSKKDYDKLRTRHGVGDVIIDKDPYL